MEHYQIDQETCHWNHRRIEKETRERAYSKKIGRKLFKSEGKNGHTDLRSSKHIHLFWDKPKENHTETRYNPGV